MNTDRVTLTVSETAALLGVSLHSCYQAIRANTLPHIRVGRRLVVPRAALDRMLGAVAGDGAGEEGPR